MNDPGGAKGIPPSSLDGSEHLTQSNSESIKKASLEKASLEKAVPVPRPLSDSSTSEKQLRNQRKLARRVLLRRLLEQRRKESDSFTDGKEQGQSDVNESSDDGDKEALYSFISSIKERYPADLSDLNETEEDRQIDKALDKEMNEKAKFFEETMLGGSVFFLPLSVLSLHSLSSLVSQETFNKFTRREKEKLMQLLPGKDKSEKQAALEMLFSKAPAVEEGSDAMNEENDSFYPSPLVKVFNEIKAGQHSAKVFASRTKLVQMEHRLYLQALRSYHEDMLMHLVSNGYLLHVITPQQSVILTSRQNVDSEDDLLFSAMPPVTKISAEKRKREPEKIMDILVAKNGEVRDRPLPPFFLFAFIKSVFASQNMIVTETSLLERIMAIPQLVADIPKSMEPRQFLRLALLFLSTYRLQDQSTEISPEPSQIRSSSKPPAAPAVQNAPVPTGYSKGVDSSSFVRIVNRSAETWQWVERRSFSDSTEEDEELTFVEQAFWFSLTRKLFVRQGETMYLSTVRQQRSVKTLQPHSSEEVAEYRRQETLRYASPDSPFEYVTCGLHTVVAPLKKLITLRSANPSNRPRDHSLLCPERPVCVCILALVRDAVARLPGGVGTRQDIALLLRDSQYIVQSESDAKISPVVSSALDRLHSEPDPCVRFDPEQRVWVYLHRHRTVNDFGSPSFETRYK